MGYKIGFIGAGKMVSHIVDGFLKDAGMQQNIVVTGRNKEKLEHFNSKRKIEISTDYASLRQCRVIVVGVSSPAVLDVLKKLDNVNMDEETIFMSIAAGVSVADMESVLPGKKMVRCMPNIAVSSNEGVMAMSPGSHIGIGEQRYLNDTFSKIGVVEWMDENLMKYVPALTGSSPAYAFLMMEAMADKAVSVGFDRKQSYRLAAQSLAGAGKLLLETGDHPGVLKDQITTAGGSTIQGVMKLEQEGFRDSIMQAMQAVNEANEK